MNQRTYHFERYRLNWNINKSHREQLQNEKNKTDNNANRTFVYVHLVLQRICVIYRENPKPLLFFFVRSFVLSSLARADGWYLNPDCGNTSRFIWNPAVLFETYMCMCFAIKIEKELPKEWHEKKTRAKQKIWQESVFVFEITEIRGRNWQTKDPNFTSRWKKNHTHTPNATRKNLE